MSSNYVSRHPTQQSVTKEQILQYLEKRPQSNRYAMAKHFSCSPSAIEDRLLSLIATGEVSRVM
ncbi:FeoC-like transcriptional regulator, partial [Acinetobacter baumannii]